jgi:DNA-binding transcriptional ArsR family regulator
MSPPPARLSVTDRTCVRPDASADRADELQAVHREALGNDHLVALSAYFTAASNETRLRMLYVLWRTGELCVCDLADLFEITQPAVSRHLKILREKAIVVARRDAQTLYYSVCTDNPFARLLVRLFEEQAASGVTLNLDGLTAPADSPDA